MNLSEIRERLERATGPDREIDRDLMALAYKRQGMFWVDLVTGDPKTTDPFGYAFTRRVDRALGLIERCGLKKLVTLSGPWFWAAHTERAGEPIWRADLDDTFEDIPASDLRFKAPTPALALLRALLAALEAEPTPTGAA